MQLFFAVGPNKIKRPEFASTGFKKWIFDYNLSHIKEKTFLTTRRSEILYRLSCDIYQLKISNKSISELNLLIVGPLNYHEILIAWLHGFSWANIVAVDMISASNKVRVGDMENLDFDGEFDVIVSCATMSCAESLELTIQSAANALREGGIFFYQAVFSANEEKFVSERNTIETHKKLLKNSGLNLFFEDYQVQVNKAGTVQTSFVFASKK